MKTNGIETGMNRTGIGMSPVDSKALIDVANRTPPSMAGDEHGIADTRGAYTEKSEKLGSVPPPATVKGAAGAALKAVKGESMSVFMDKLGERLAFERSGTRLYDGVIAKFKVMPPAAGGPLLEELLEIRNEEFRHFELLERTMKNLGGDPTALTPSADVAAVVSMGAPQLVSDPRTTFTQCLQAVLVAELTDTDGWFLLATLAERLGHDKLAAEFREAQIREATHLERVRSWLTELTLTDGGVSSA
jgi:rubrerythrin